MRELGLQEGTEVVARHLHQSAARDHRSKPVRRPDKRVALADQHQYRQSNLAQLLDVDSVALRSLHRRQHGQIVPASFGEDSEGLSCRHRRRLSVRCLQRLSDRLPALAARPAASDESISEAG
jgi:hypothetical protein